MKKAYALGFALLLTLLAVPGVQADASKSPSKGTSVIIQDPGTDRIKCYVCSDDGTLCVQVQCGKESEPQ